MKGIIFNLLEEFITENFGEESYDKIVSKAQLKTTEPFIAPGTYPDEELLKLVVSATEVLQIPIPDALRAFGKFAFPKLAARYPVFLKNQIDAKQFLLSVDSIIHVEVNKLYAHAYTPQFTYRDTAPDQLTITYFSKRKLYDLMAGLLDGVGAYFNTTIQQSRKLYEENGEERCDFELVFVKGS